MEPYWGWWQWCPRTIYPHILHAIKHPGNVLLVFQSKLLYNVVFTVSYAPLYQLQTCIVRQTWLFNNFVTHLDSTGLCLLFYSAMVRQEDWGHWLLWDQWSSYNTLDWERTIFFQPLVLEKHSTRGGCSMPQLTWPCYLHTETLKATSSGSILYLPSLGANKPRCLDLYNSKDFFYSFTRVRKFGTFFSSVS